MRSADDILYELFVFAEWRPDPDLVRGQVTGKSPFVQRLNHFWRQFTPEQTLQEYISNFVDQLQSWQICLGENGKAVAILQDTLLEIRTKRGNFSNAVARTAVAKDPNPQWRKMAWSPDCSMLAVASSNGRVCFYDLLGANLFTIQPDCSQPLELQCTDTTHAVASIIFLTNRIVDHKWSNELLLIDYKGSLRSFFVSPTDGCKLYHQFKFEGGVSTAVYHIRHNMIFISGLPSTLKKEGTRSVDYGLQGWRLLNDSPFYKLSAEYNTPQAMTYSSMVLYYLPLWNKPIPSVITNAAISPNGSLLACTHIDGTVSVWQIPILKLHQIWHPGTEPELKMDNPTTSVAKSRVWPILSNGLTENTAVDLNWWNDEAIIISHINGCVSICSIADFHNMLKSKPVFFQGHPQITGTFDNGFLSLECEANLTSAKKMRQSSESESINNTEDLTDDGTMAVETVSVLSRAMEIFKTVLYLVTDMERFQPAPKQLNLLSRIFRLLCLKSTTPEDLYLRKIENAEYEEALTLAETFDLDSDCVYQQQWRCSKVSSQSIKNYLGKVVKRNWVIQQCCDRIPDTAEAAKELLEFGLKLTNKEIFNGLNNTVDKKTFYEKKLWDKITPEELSVQSMELLRYRYTMLFYFDRLEMYKSIVANENSSYNAEEYNRLRTNTICHSAIEYAKEGRIEALVCLWPHLQDLSLQLIALQYLPETLNPHSYRSILPSMKDTSVSSSQKNLKRSSDWCEKEVFRSIWSSVEIDDFSLEDNNFENVECLPPSTNLTEWYSARAHQIEKMSGLSQYALTLIKLGIEKNIPGLDSLYYSLLTLDVILYDINVEPFSLAQLEESSQSQIANILMSKTSKQTFIGDLKSLMMPYLEQCQRSSSVPMLKESLLDEYILNLCKTDLSLALLFFQHLSEFGFTVQKSLELAEKCFMAQSGNSLGLYFDLLEVLPESCDNSIAPSQLIKTLDEMERTLNACNLLKSHDIELTYSELKSVAHKSKESQDLLIRMARNASKKCRNGNDWNNLLQDILNLNGLMYSSIETSLCHEIFASSLLSSGNKQSILSADQILTCQSSNGNNQNGDSSASNSNKNKPPFKISVSQKVPFDKSVSLVLDCAHEYYKSSSDLNDYALDLAGTCLQLIKEDVEEIQTEKNLLSALKILNDFELSVLPVQVRLYPSKIEFIEECLNCNEKTYKYVDKVLQLAKLLGIAGREDKKREAMIVSLCAIKSIEAKDYNEAKKLGKYLVTISDGPNSAHGVVAAQKLGSDANLPDLTLRHQLLNIALLHCQPQCIEELLQIRSTVESEILQNEINNLINMTNADQVKQVNLQDSIESTEEDYVDALTSPIVENKLITAAQAVERYGQKAFSALTDKNNWKNALNFRWPKDENIPQAFGENSGKLACHYFYSSLHRDCHNSSLNIQYDRFSTPDIHNPQLVILYSLVRNYMLLDTIKYGSDETHHLEALIQCAKYTLPEDTSYCISQLLSAHNHANFYEHVHQLIKLDMKNAHIMLYAYALINYIKMNILPDEGFYQSPRTLIANTFKTIRKNNKEQLSESLQSFQDCRQIMLQLIEGKKLLDIGCNVNVAMFTHDSDYRTAIILDLCKTHDEERFALASALAKKYGISELDVITNNIQFIIMNHSAKNFSYSLNKISNPTVIEKLQEAGPNVLEKFHSQTWENLNGNDDESLMLFFKFIDGVNNRFLIQNLTAKDHLKIIVSCPQIDYKDLLKCETQDDLLKFLMPTLTKDNVGPVAKSLRSLAQSKHLEFNSSRYYCEWLIKYFFNVSENIQSSKKWMQQYRECSSYFDKLCKEDLLVFTREIVFGDTALKKISPSTRLVIVRQTQDYCLQEHEYYFKNSKNRRSFSKDEESWENIASKVCDWKMFLAEFHSESMKNVLDKSDLPPTILIELEQSQGCEETLKNVLANVIFQNKDLSIKQFLPLVNVEEINIAMEHLLLENLENSDIDSNHLSRIADILIEAKTTDNFLNANLLDKMKAFTTSHLLTSKQRLNLMSLYKMPANEENGEMLEKMSMELIDSIWGQEVLFNFNEVKIEDPYNRNDIFIRLINGNLNWEKLKTLVDLINMWPLQVQETREKSPHLLLVKKLLLNELYLDDNIPLLKLLIAKQTIAYEDIQWIVSDQSINNVFGKIWLCVLLPDENVHKNVLPKLALEIQDANVVNDYFCEDLMFEIVQKRLVVLLVTTKLYPKLVQFLIKKSYESENNLSYTVVELIEDLRANKHHAEAGALKMISMGVPNTLRGFSQSLLLKFD